MDSSGASLSKLIPRSISAKRRRRKHKRTQGDDDSPARSADDRGRSRELLREGDGTRRNGGSGDGEDDANDDDDRSFGSYESYTDPGSESSPSRPATLSAHPSLIGYLTTASPEVQATHIESQSTVDSPVSVPSTQAASIDDPVKETSPIPPPVLEPPAAARVAGPAKRSRGRLSVDVDVPRTPPKDDSFGPVIVNTPPTPTIDEGQSRFSTPERRHVRGFSASNSSLDGTPPNRNMSAHRRSRSGSLNAGPSKLSNITTAPLTPTTEAAEPTPTPGGTPSSGFFSSMITAAQTAANNLSTNIQNTGINLGGAKGKTTPSKSPSIPASPGQQRFEATPEPEPDGNMDQKESAVRTMGAGDLSLSHLGLDESAAAPAASPASARFPDISDNRARSESAPADANPGTVDALPTGFTSRPRSLNETHSGDDSAYEHEVAEDTGIQRKASVRSTAKAHRKRGSSVTTSATVPAIAPLSNNPLAPAPPLGAPKLTGFAIASKKRNRDFHTIFKSVPDDDYLIEDYSCALQREILAHGRLYVSEGHLCFSSNILGWTTTLVMSFDEIVSVEKRSTALVFKNGLMISTLHAKHIFASFTSRDATYDLIVNIWKLGHQGLTSTLNGVPLEGTGGDKTEKLGAEDLGTESQAGSETEEESDEDEDEDEYYDEEENEDAHDSQLADSSPTEGENEKIVSRKASGMTTVASAPPSQMKEGSPTVPGTPDFPGPPTHPPTECGDASTHYEKVVGDELIPAPLGKVYTLMFGPASVAWMSKWLTGDQKCTELQMADKKGLTLENKSRTYNYIKPLYASLGPKQTKCIVTETMDIMELDKAVSFSVSTQTPDVPNGNIFTVKTKYCLSWGENNSTRVQVNCTVEWTGKSWLKGTIEKACAEGQVQFCKDLFASLKVAVSKPRANTMPGGPSKAKRKAKKSKALQSPGDEAQGQDPLQKAARQDWGPLEPLHKLAEPFLDVVQPLLTGNVMYGLLVGLLVASWFGFGLAPSRGASPFGAHVGILGPDRLAAYEEMWRREDSELWEWLEDRVGLDVLNPRGPHGRKKAVEPRSLEERLREEQMDQREVEEAIRVTEEKLEILKGVVNQAGRRPEEGPAASGTPGDKAQS